MDGLHNAGQWRLVIGRWACGSFPKNTWQRKESVRRWIGEPHSESSTVFRIARWIRVAAASRSKRPSTNELSEQDREFGVKPTGGHLQVRDQSVRSAILVWLANVSSRLFSTFDSHLIDLFPPPGTFPNGSKTMARARAIVELRFVLRYTVCCTKS